MKIVVLDGYTENPGDLSWSAFEVLGELVVHDRTPQGDLDAILSRVEGAQAVLTNKTPLNAEFFARAKGLMYVGVLATGYNVVDAAAARAQGVAVTNIPAYGTDAVAQFAIALLLEICHRIGHHSNEVSRGRWSGCPDFCFWDYPLIELAGKTMGIVGYGRIGQAVGRIAASLGMRVLACDPQTPVAGVAEPADLETVLKQSDVISLHCPLTLENAEMINASSISRMKDGAIIINNSRGGLIREHDLADALNSGKIYAAGLDVVASEPISPDNPLLKAKNCIITPHISWASRESRIRLMEIAAANLRAFMEGAPENVVN
jgi:glycerate dehydrogenase